MENENTKSPVPAKERSSFGMLVIPRTASALFKKFVAAPKFFPLVCAVWMSPNRPLVGFRNRYVVEVDFEFSVPNQMVLGKGVQLWRLKPGTRKKDR